MGNRRLVYTGQSPQDLDINQNAQFSMIADGFLAEAVVGQGPWAYGLAMTATSPASMSLNVERGALGQMTVVDETDPGTSAIADTADALLKVGINLTSTTLTFVAPPTSGQSQVFLIQGQMQESDTGAAILPYFNPTAPYPSFAGPANSGASSNTIRQQVVALEVVAGAPASTGSQTAPSVTSGWSPLYLVTLVNGQTTITASSFTVHPAAPFILYNLRQLVPTRAYSSLNNGIITFPGGMILQTSTAAVPAGGGLVTTTVTLPVAFPNEMFEATICFGGNTPPGSANPGSISVLPVSNSQVQVTTNYQSVANGTLGVVISTKGF